MDHILSHPSNQITEISGTTTSRCTISGMCGVSLGGFFNFLGLPPMNNPERHRTHLATFGGRRWTERHISEHKQEQVHVLDREPGFSAIYTVLKKGKRHQSNYQPTTDVSFSDRWALLGMPPYHSRPISADLAAHYYPYSF